MEATTRREALDYARLQYVALRNRALETATGADRDYIIGLATRWEEELRRLGRLGSSIVVQEDVVMALLRLARRASSDLVEGDSLVEWIDAFPEAVTVMFPPSESTFRLEGATTSGERSQLPEAALAA